MASLDLKERGAFDARMAALDKIIEASNKKAGKTIIGRIAMSPEIQERLKITYIPTASIDVNDAMGGGFPRRRSTIVAGNADSGKTSICLETIGMAMKKDPEFIAGWLESEGSLNMSYLQDTFGIDPKRFVYAEMDRKEGAEIALDRIEALLGAGSLDIMVINSLKALVPSEEMNKSLTESVVAVDLGRLAA